MHAAEGYARVTGKKAFYIARTGLSGSVLIDITKDAQFELFDYHYQYLFVGQGVTISHAEKEVIALAEKNNIPVVSTLLGLSTVFTQHPLYVGLLGMHRNYAANVLTDEADVVIAVGMRFDDRVKGNVEKFLPHAKVIHANVALHADAKKILSALVEQVESKSRKSWLQQFYSLHKQAVGSDDSGIGQS